MVSKDLEKIPPSTRKDKKSYQRPRPLVQFIVIQSKTYTFLVNKFLIKLLFKMYKNKNTDINQFSNQSKEAEFLSF